MINQVELRWLIRRDIDAAVAIDHTGGGVGMYHNADELLEDLRQRNCIGMVAESGKATLGFMVYEFHKDRLFVRRIGVAAAHRRSGIGSKLIAKLVGKLHAQRRTEIRVHVPYECLGAQLFFSRLGFFAIPETERISMSYFI